VGVSRSAVSSISRLFTIGTCTQMILFQQLANSLRALLPKSEN
jgi:hypothetical protein